MSRRKIVYEGKAKILYEGPEAGTLVQYFKDDATANNGEKHEVLQGKGIINNRISEFIMAALNEIGIPTHFIKRLNMREQLIRQVEIIPLEVVVRNVAAGSLCKRLGLEHGTLLSRNLIEFYYKDDALGDPLVSEEHIATFGWATGQELEEMMSTALRVNDFLMGIFHAQGIKLVDMKMEFGRSYENDSVRLMLADEISPDSCRLWDIRTNEILDKDRFRQDLGDVTESYNEIAKRLGIVKNANSLAAENVANLADHKAKNTTDSDRKNYIQPVPEDGA